MIFFGRLINMLWEYGTSVLRYPRVFRVGESCDFSIQGRHKGDVGKTMETCGEKCEESGGNTESYNIYIYI